MLNLINPKLVFLDMPLFMALLADLFPGLEAPPPDRGPLRDALEAELRAAGLQVGQRARTRCAPPEEQQLPGGAWARRP